jgi:hypothetical protein
MVRHSRRSVVFSRASIVGQLAVVALVSVGCKSRDFNTQDGEKTSEVSSNSWKTRGLSSSSAEAVLGLSLKSHHVPKNYGNWRPIDADVFLNTPGISFDYEANKRTAPCAKMEQKAAAELSSDSFVQEKVKKWVEYCTSLEALIADKALANPYSAVTTFLPLGLKGEKRLGAFVQVIQARRAYLELFETTSNRIQEDKSEVPMFIDAANDLMRFSPARKKTCTGRVYLLLNGESETAFYAFTGTGFWAWFKKVATQANIGIFFDSREAVYVVGEGSTETEATANLDKSVAELKSQYTLPNLVDSRSMFAKRSTITCKEAKVKYEESDFPALWAQYESENI